MSAVTVTLDGRPTPLVFREPTVGDLIACGEWRLKATSVDPARRITTTHHHVDVDALIAAVSRLTGIGEEEAADLSLADIHRVLAALDVVLAGNRAHVLDLADEFVFGLEWAPSEVERMTITTLVHWYRRAVERKRRKRG